MKPGSLEYRASVPSLREDDQFDRLLVALGAIHGGVEEGGYGIAGRHHAHVFQPGGGGGEAEADDQGDDGHDDHHLDERDAATGAGIRHRSLTVAARHIGAVATYFSN